MTKERKIKYSKELLEVFETEFHWRAMMEASEQPTGRPVYESISELADEFDAIVMGDEPIPERSAYDSLAKAERRKYRQSLAQKKYNESRGQDA